jgi:hypothetical protein
MALGLTQPLTEMSRGKAIPLQAWTGPEDSRRLRLPDFKTIGRLYPQEIFLVLISLGGHAVAQLVEALRYKPEGRGFDSRWCHWKFSLT